MGSIFDEAAYRSGTDSLLETTLASLHKRDVTGPTLPPTLFPQLPNAPVGFSPNEGSFGCNNYSESILAMICAPC